MLNHAPAEFVPVVVTAFVSVPVGMLWFSKNVFGKSWMKMNKMSPDVMKKGPGMNAYAVSFLSALVMSFTIWLLTGVMGLNTLPTAWSITIVLWLSFTFFPSFTRTLFARKPIALLMINTGYQLTNALLMATILTYWR